MSPLVVDATGNDLTYRVIGAAMTVHNQLGSDFKEEVNERALEVELNRLGIPVQRQYPVPVEYQGEQVVWFTWIFTLRIKMWWRSSRSVTC